MGSALAAEAKSGGGNVGITDDIGGGGGSNESASPYDTAQVGLWVLLGSLTMLFAAFTSAYLVRRTGSDWVRIQVVPLLWVNTLLLLAGSVTVEIARSSFNSWKLLATRRWLLLTFVLGIAFVVGQVFAWRELAGAGIFLHSNPHSSFFYVFTGVHAAHVIGGLGALLYVLVLSLGKKLNPGETGAPGLVATYWHFIGIVWVYLFAVLFLV